MHVTVRLFGPYAQELGESLWLELDPPATPQAVFAFIQDRSPRLAGLRDHCRPAVNWEFADWGTPLQEGDEVAFIPPVSGGQ